MKFIYNPLTGTFDASPDSILKSIGTAKGDLIGFSASGTPVRVGVGTDGQVVVADSASTPGWKWGRQKFYGAHVRHNGAQSINDNTSTLANLDQTLYDTGSFADLVNDKVVITDTGYYFVLLYARFDANATGIREITWLVNGAAYATITQPNAGSADSTTCTFPITYQYNSGDYIQLNVRQTSGGALNVRFPGINITRFD